MSDEQHTDPSAADKATLLIADDDKNILFAFRKAFKSLGWHIIEAGTGEEALDVITTHTPDVVYMDIQMPGLNGLEVLKRLTDTGVEVPVIVITGYGTMQTAIDAIQLGAYEYITKPLDLERVRTLAQRALEVARLKSEVKELRNLVSLEPEPYELIGQSQVMLEIYKQIGTIASTPSETTVLITGESGTGKELVARNIHKYGPHNEAPFQAINCTVLPETLLESELFGHERGAFTGATERKPGKFEQAETGTIFLDEIGDIPPNFQKELLRVIQEREFERVGGTELIPVKARFITATHQNLHKKVDNGEFREDLFYRINVLHINLPPLKKHKEDIPLLCEHFLLRANRKFGKSVRSVSSELLGALQAYDFPGNIRELEHLIERGVAMAKTNVLGMESLPSELWGRFSSLECAAMNPVHIRDLNKAREAVRTNFEREFVKARLRETDGNVSKAARIAGIERQSFQRLMRKHNINSQDFRE